MGEGRGGPGPGEPSGGPRLNADKKSRTEASPGARRQGEQRKGEAGLAGGPSCLGCPSLGSASRSISFYSGLGHNAAGDRARRIRPGTVTNGNMSEPVDTRGTSPAHPDRQTFSTRCFNGSVASQGLVCQVLAEHCFVSQSSRSSRNASGTPRGRGHPVAKLLCQ